MDRSNLAVRRPRRPRMWRLSLLWGVVLAGLLHISGFWSAVTSELIKPQSTVVAGELAGPQANDRQIALMVSQLVQGEHLSKHALDDEMSRRALKLFLKQIDPMKVYFYQSDVEEFQKRQNDIDDMIKKGDVSFAYTIYQRFLQRADERLKTVEALLKEKLDFTADEEMVTDPELAKYAKDENEALERWRKRIKFDLLVLKGSEKDKKDKEKDNEDPIVKLQRRYSSFNKRMHQTDGDELLEWYLTAMTSSFDPHTDYMSPSTLNNFDIAMKLKLEGIGAALQMEDGYTTVSKIIPGGAADKDGHIKPEDRIVSVGQGEKGEMEDVVDLKLNDVVNKIRGKAGTIVRLGVTKPHGAETKVYNITRAQIELKDSEARGVIFDEGKKPNGTPYRVGVINLPSFYMDMSGAKKGGEDFKSTTRDCRKIIEDFKTKGVDALVLDLRYNGGGSLTEAINLTGLFIDRGPVVQVKDPDGRVQHYDDLDAGAAWEGPLVVLTSKFSASASEILAGAIQDYKRGLIVGDVSTHGKGTVQSLLELGSQLFRIPNPPNLGALKITMQQFYRPNGDSTQKRGVLADVILPSITTHMDVGESDLEYSLDFDKVPAAKYATVDQVTADMLPKLKEASEARRGASSDFSKLAHRIDRYKQQKQRKTVTLNEKKFLDERKEVDADKEEEKQFDEQVKGNDEVVKKDYYFNEVLAITLDYIDLLGKGKVAQASRTPVPTP